MPEISSHHASYRQLPVHYLRCGSGTPVVLLHGFLGSAEMWNAYLKELGRAHLVLAPDLLGHGQTPCLGYVHTMEEMADAVLSVMDQEGVERAAVIGHSMGGYVALALAENSPNRVSRYGLFHSTTKPDSEEKKKDRNRAIGVVKRGVRAYIRTAVPGLFDPGRTELLVDEIDAYTTLALTTSAQGVIAALEGMKIRPDRERLLHDGQHPVLLISGTHDPVLTPERMGNQHLAPKVEQYLELPIGHMGFIEAPEACYQAIKTFVGT